VIHQEQLTEAIKRFSLAIKHVIQTVPKELIVNHLANTPHDELQQMLITCEQLEEYEMCEPISKALAQKKQLVAA
jgi:hypothetical protein